VDTPASAEYKGIQYGRQEYHQGQRGHSATRTHGPEILASGIRLSMRLWERESADTQPKAEAARNYEMAGYVIAGRAELHIEGQVVDLEPGDSWIVPKGSRHSYKILEAFTALIRKQLQVIGAWYFCFTQREYSISGGKVPSNRGELVRFC
jgi:quercetin dioxygenase-like cupin family protein